MSKHIRTQKSTLSKRINIGCGDDYREGWHNVDHSEEAHPDEIVDLNRTPWPWPDSSFEYVLASNVVEHLDNQLICLNELHRITEPGGQIEVRVPHPNSPGFWNDPTHTTPVYLGTFDHELAPDWRIEDIRISRVRFGRLLPQSVALRLSEHVGHIVDELTVVLRV